MSPEFRAAEQYEPPLTWEEWRTRARMIFFHRFHRPPGVTKAQHEASVWHEWAEEEFEVDYENGKTPTDAVNRYFEERGDIDDDQNEPL